MSADGEKVPVTVVLALGVTQIIGYGTLYYSFSILAPDMAKDLGWSVDRIFAIFSGSLLVGGIAAPIIGRWMDRFGASTLMAVGSAIAAITLVLCAYSWSPVTFIAGIILLEICSGLVQYQAAFAALVEIRPRSASRSITYLTLIAGFASTLFWPITSMLHTHLTWREIYLLYATLNLAICLPLHFWITQNQRAVTVNNGKPIASPVIGALAPAQRRLGFYIVSAAFALQGFALSAMLVHMVPMLTAIGLGGSAVMVGALFGPSQVLSRLINMIFGRNMAPPLLATLSAVFIVAGIAALLFSGSWLPGAVVFAILLGLGSGINSIAQGALPLWLFGSEGYGSLTGQMASVRLVSAAAAPFAFAFLAENIGNTLALTITVFLGAAGIVAFLATTMQSRQRHNTVVT